MARPTTYSPLIIPIVRACATFGATAPEIANYIGTSIASFDRWTMEHEELREALKRGREASDARVEESLYRNALAGNTTAQIFWLKNRRPDRWRDVQNINADVRHYIISDRPLSESEWIEQRTKVIESKAEQTNTEQTNNVASELPADQDDTDKPLE
jgi:hypothetical protein